MSNFKLNLPIDIPWKLIDSSPDMMDGVFCDNKSPNPFRSSLAIYAYEPNADELPVELCGDRITYLKVSCSIAGFQPSENEKAQIVKLLEGQSVDYSKIEQIIGEYLGCYGVLLNVSVHPFDDALKGNFDKYPRIVDFEPEIRDFYQAATETGEVHTASTGRITTGKSFGSVDTTQSSWQGTANASVSPEAMAALAGVPVGVGATGTTGQVRTDTDQQNWNVDTDASRERREMQSTTTQLSQMYNLLTGYHSGSNRVTFVMLPRPHILQPTDRRTFVQGLRIIEGVQDFFLVVIRPAGQDKLKVDAHLQTGHFPENIEIVEAEDVDKYNTLRFDVPIEDSVDGSSEQTIFGDGYVTKKMSKTRDVVDESNGWEADPTRGDPGHGGVKEIRKDSKVTISEVDTETGEVLSTHEETIPAESGKIEDVEYGITDGKLIVTATLKASRKNLLQSYGIAVFSRIYRVYLRRLKANTPAPRADIAGLLITQRALCVQIKLGECITKVPFDNPFADFGIVIEPGFNLDDLFDIPYGTGINTGAAVAGIHQKGPRFDFAFKKGLIRRIQQTMITAVTSPLRYPRGQVGYLQSRHFQNRLLRVLPAKLLDRSIREIDFVDGEIKERMDVSLRELLSADSVKLAAKAGITPADARAMRTRLFRSRSG